ncbi:MAG: heparan-alpha-glucosaminide N-acetyltransferase domain-containing protein [Bacteroidota bacterium]
MPHSKQRYLFIDLLRFLAVVFMIQGHTFDALLDFDLRSDTLFYAHDFFHGFIAPMFLFASGVAFGISTFKKWEDHRVFSGHARRRYGKFAGLILIGYALHLPYFSLTKILKEGTPVDFAVWLQVDALHCIAVTMLILQTAVLILKEEKRFFLFTASLSVVIILLSPIIWSIDLNGSLPLWLVSYINVGNNSWFPLFPWSAYILCGVVFAYIFLNAKEHHHAVILMQRTVTIGLLLMITSFIFLNIPFHLYPPHDVWKVNPLIILARLGFVMLATSGVFFAEHTYKIRSKIPQIMGRESLFIYIIHLIILYGSVMNKGLQQIILPTLSVVQSSVAFIIVFIALSSFTYGWYQLKKQYPRSALYVRVAVAATFIILFLIRPY